MDDYLSEKEQWERVKQLLRENGLWVVAGVVVGVALLGGYRWWQDHVDQQALNASTKYQQILGALATDRSRAFGLLGEMERDYSSSPYLDQAKLVIAKVYVESGEMDKAASELQSVVQNSKDKDLALLARARLARVQVSQKKFDDALATLNAGDAGAFAAIFHEVRGDAYHAKGNDAAALTEYQAARGGELTGATDSQMLDLKIADLPVQAAGSTSKPTQPPAAAAAK